MFGWRSRRTRQTGDGDDPEFTDEAGYDLSDDSDDPYEEGGPYDEAEAPDDDVERLDLGSVRLPVPENSQLQVEVDPEGPVRAVHLLTPSGRLTVSAFAAPRSGDLWHEVRDELVRQLRSDGAEVRSENGVWGEELLADTGKAVLRFVGVDGPGGCCAVSRRVRPTMPTRAANCSTRSSTRPWWCAGRTRCRCAAHCRSNCPTRSPGTFSRHRNRAKNKPVSPMSNRPAPPGSDSPRGGDGATKTALG